MGDKKPSVADLIRALEGNKNNSDSTNATKPRTNSRTPVPSGSNVANRFTQFSNKDATAPSEPVRATPVPRAQTIIKKESGVPVVPHKPVPRSATVTTKEPEITKNVAPPKLPEKPKNLEELIIPVVTEPVVENDTVQPTSIENEVEAKIEQTTPLITPIEPPPTATRERAMAGSRIQTFLKTKDHVIPILLEKKDEKDSQSIASPITTPSVGPTRVVPVPRAQTIIKRKETNTEESESPTSLNASKPAGPTRAPTRQDSISKSLRPETMLIVPKLEESLKLGKLPPLKQSTTSIEPPNKFDKIEKPEGVQMDTRGKISKEIYDTERAYCSNIATIVSEFLLPLESEGILKKTYIEKIFGNIEEIVNLHLPMLKNLAITVENWDLNSCIGTIFENIVPHFKAYNSYCANYHHALVCLEDKSSRSSKFSNYLAAKKESSKWDLSSLLIQPVQRIPRYRLLFTELKKNTPESHPDYAAVVSSLIKIEETAVIVNESIREKENQDKLLQLQNAFTGKLPIKIVDPDRKFIREGVLVKLCRREPKRRYFILFNDLLIYATVHDSNNTFTFHRHFELSQVRVIDNPENEDSENNAFQFLSNQKSFTVYAESADDKGKWLQAFELAKTITLRLQKSPKNVATSTVENPENSSGEVTPAIEGEQESIAPVWVPDKLLKTCMLCSSKFTAINRRHHCRKCGKLVCGTCSARKMKLPNFGKPCRVCDECFSATGTFTPSSASKRVAKSTDESSQVSKAKQNLAKVATRKFRESKHPAASTNSLFNPNSYSSLTHSGATTQTVPNSAPPQAHNANNNQAPKKINLQDIFKSPIIQQNSNGEVTNDQQQPQQPKTLAKESSKLAESSPITTSEPSTPSPVIDALANRPKPPSRTGTPNGSRIVYEESAKSPTTSVTALKSTSNTYPIEYTKPKPPPRAISRQNLIVVSENDELSLLASLNTLPTTTPPASPSPVPQVTQPPPPSTPSDEAPVDVVEESVLYDENAEIVYDETQEDFENGEYYGEEEYEYYDEAEEYEDPVSNGRTAPSRPPPAVPPSRPTPALPA